MRATFKIILFSRANKGGLRPVMLRVTFLRRARYYPLHRYCLPEQWDASAGDYQAAYGALRFQNIGGVPVGVWGRCAGQGGQGGVLMG